MPVATAVAEDAVEEVVDISKDWVCGADVRFGAEWIREGIEDQFFD